MAYSLQDKNLRHKIRNKNKLEYDFKVILISILPMEKTLILFFWTEP